MKRTFDSDGNWYKGNLHCHSVLSDGKLTVDQLKQAYKDKGYHFLAYSEHDLYTDHQELDEEHFITIPAVEVNVPTPKGDERIYHLHVIYGTNELREAATLEPLKHMERIRWKSWEGLSTVQEVIDEMTARGYIVMMNHPNWSLLEWHDVMDLENLFAIEVYNHCSRWLENMGESNVFWDSLLRRGKRVWGMATDDNHNVYPLDSIQNDSFGGWVMVKAETLSRDAIVEALVKGSFYSSTGPEIYDFRVEGDEVVFECSPVEQIYVNGDLRQYHSVLGNNVTGLRKKLKGTEKYVRIECVDQQGKKAYTNPIFLDSF